MKLALVGLVGLAAALLPSPRPAEGVHARGLARPRPRPRLSPVVSLAPAPRARAPSCVRRKAAESETDEAEAEVEAEAGEAEGVSGAEEAEAEEAEAEAPDPAAAAAAAELAELRKEIADLDATLKEKRLALSRARGAKDLGGERGYRTAVAAVATYKRQAAEQQAGAAEVAKADAFRAFDGVLAAFESALVDLPPSDDAEAKAHSDFQSIYDGLLEQFTVLGMETFTVEAGAAYSAAAHETVEEVEGDGDEPSIVECRSAGFRLKSTGAIIRKAKCAVAAAKPAVEAEADADADADAADADVDDADADDADADADAGDADAAEDA